jgi:adenosylmethionine-8-amino-7-oxononanoate aminotransferase
LAQLAPGKLGHCFYGSDGASAIEIALKMSFHYWRNHGRTDKTRFLATYTKVGADAEDITIAAFNGDQWPPLAETALCGTFTYSRAK